MPQGLLKTFDDRQYDNLFSNSQFQLVTALLPVTKPSKTGSGSAPTFTATAVSRTGPGNIITVTVTPNSSNQIFPHALVQLVGSGLPTGISPYKSDAGLTQTTALHILTTSGSPVSSFTALAPYPYTGASWSGTATGTIVTRGDLSGVTGDAADGWAKHAQMLCWLEDDPANIPPMAARALAVQKTASGEQDISQNLSATMVRELQGQFLTASFAVKHLVHTGAGTWRPWVSIDGGAKIYGSIAPGFGLQYQQQIVQIPVTALAITAGISFDGAVNDVYYASLPMAAKAYGLPYNYYAQRREQRFIPKVSPANTLDLYNASYTFSTSQTVPTLGGGNQPGFVVDIYGESCGEIHWSISGFYGDLEMKSASSFSGKVATFFAHDGFGNYSPCSNNYFPQVASQTISWESFVPIVNGLFSIGGSSGLALFNCNIDIFNYSLGY